SGARVRTPLAGDIVPTSMQNPIAGNFAKYYPPPTPPGHPNTPANNLFSQGSTPSQDHQIDAKNDQNNSQKQRFSSRYSVDWGYSGVANLYGNIAQGGAPGTSRSQNFIMDYTRTQNATTVYTLRGTVLRVRSLNDPLSTGFDATTLGLPAYMT